ncbi:MAG: ATP-binding protein [Alphaproteobacteria bacterium]|nr:ATP-binding protein [Alphaproteobacteria bacterium]
MRLRTFIGGTMTEAMEQVREELGPEAIIVSTYNRRRGRGVEITAAIERSDDEAVLEAEIAEVTAPNGSDAVSQALTGHGVPSALASRLGRVARSMDVAEPALALAGALDAGFSFAPLPKASERAVMLIGPPGVGKTVTIAKLAARSVMAGQNVAVVTTDTIRAGGVEQLEAFTRLLERPLHRAETPDELGSFVSDHQSADLALIDSPGTNPFSPAELNDLRRFIDKRRMEPVLVLAAGGDALEAAEMAAAFQPLGIQRLVVTRLDIARRYGCILTAADAAHLTLSEVSLTPYVAQGLNTVNPVSLARLFMGAPTESDSAEKSHERAAE